jgi:hypothetical protein
MSRIPEIGCAGIRRGGWGASSYTGRFKNLLSKGNRFVVAKNSGGRVGYSGLDCEGINNELMSAAFSSSGHS